ncbi:hypothetical protein ONR75_15840 [Rhodopseudomonas sp. P2A-2r]|uniref:hypothetical protein n=1 Tax=Rhodopseudomonas sp. P2A-2r TaxID=2991972 RepID=UPI0022343A6D|nr:hypothetical protein [Rhodopseudomonas sp. P2A-2r]UZE51902.1 hypothetical protein ONR75_15840 [Rhodopseudomonas sp. P2A-2r]
MASLVLGVKFIPASAGAGSFVFAAAVTGYLAPTAAMDGKTYRYRAENPLSPSEWEWGATVYSNSTGTFTRVVSFSSTGGTVAFTGIPQVGLLLFPADILQFDDAMSLTTAQQGMGRANIGVPGANLLINPDFRVNQRVYVSAAALAVGIYGHDRWKAGAAGGDYSFAQLASSTTITIASGKTLIQVVEDKNVEGGTYVLSWTGTAQARAGVNSATPSGSYAASPLIIAGQTAGTVMSVEFNAGTLGKAKLEVGLVPTPFVMSSIDIEAAKCLRYFEVVIAPSGAGNAIFSGSLTGTNALARWEFKVQKRVNPTFAQMNSSTWQNATPANVYIDLNGIWFQTTVGSFFYLNGTIGLPICSASSEL